MRCYATQTFHNTDKNFSFIKYKYVKDAMVYNLHSMTKINKIIKMYSISIQTIIETVLKLKEKKEKKIKAMFFRSLYFRL